MIGTTISHYRILEKLGDGGMGIVYKAQDLKLDRLVALKFLPHHLTANDVEQARFLQAAKAAAVLNHQAFAPFTYLHCSGPVGGFCRFSLFSISEGQRRQLEHEPELVV